MNLPTFHIRPIQPADNAAVASIIRSVMPEFGADGPGFAIHDAEVDKMAQAYSAERSAYWVIERADRVVGGGGVASLTGGPPDVCELRKMYFLRELRGLGAGQALMRQCLDAAHSFGFRRCYLETLAGMTSAQSLYLKSGFQRIEQPMGGTGHFSCDRFYLRDL